MLGEVGIEIKSGFGIGIGIAVVRASNLLPPSADDRKRKQKGQARAECSRTVL